MKKLPIEPGEHISHACKQLAKAAPAFMVFNDIRVEAAEGESAETLFSRWNAESIRRSEEHEASEARKQHDQEMVINAANDLVDAAHGFELDGPVLTYTRELERRLVVAGYRVATPKRRAT